jgi:hypothetical protein
MDPPANRSTAGDTVKLTLGCLYLVAATWWAMPPGTPGRDPVVRLAAGPFNALGLWQSWDMFAPDPMPADIYVSLFAVLEDGTIVEGDLTYMPALDILTRYTTERWRRFCNDHLRLDVNQRLWPDAARWFAGRIEREAGQRVMRLVLWRHWRYTVPPGPDGAPPQRPEWLSAAFHAWDREP